MTEHATYLTAKQVCERYQITDMTIWRWLKNDKLHFPRPMMINRRRYFLESDIIAWERQQAGRAAA